MIVKIIDPTLHKNVSKGNVPNWTPNQTLNWILNKELSPQFYNNLPVYLPSNNF